MHPLFRRPLLATFLISGIVTGISLLAVEIAFRVVTLPILPVVYFLTIMMPLVMTPLFIYPLLALNRRQERLAVELRHQAGTDALTGLPNRRAFFEFAGRAIAGGAATGAVAALMIDIDNFKRINDDFGHDHGDLVLRRVADVIRAEVEATRAPAAIAARLGGEEFAVMVTGLAPSAVARLAERLCGHMHRDTTGRGENDAVTISIGVALRKAGMGVDQMLKAADQAVYAAKQAGRDRWAYADGAAESAQAERRQRA